MTTAMVTPVSNGSTARSGASTIAPPKVNAPRIADAVPTYKARSRANAMALAPIVALVPITTSKIGMINHSDASDVAMIGMRMIEPRAESPNDHIKIPRTLRVSTAFRFQKPTRMIAVAIPEKVKLYIVGLMPNFSWNKNDELAKYANNAPNAKICVIA